MPLVGTLVTSPRLMTRLLIVSPNPFMSNKPSRRMVILALFAIWLVAWRITTALCGAAVAVANNHVIRDHALIAGGPVRKTTPSFTWWSRYRYCRRAGELKCARAFLDQAGAGRTEVRILNDPGDLRSTAPGPSLTVKVLVRSHEIQGDIRSDDRSVAGSVSRSR